MSQSLTINKLAAHYGERFLFPVSLKPPVALLHSQKEAQCGQIMKSSQPGEMQDQNTVTSRVHLLYGKLLKQNYLYSLSPLQLKQRQAFYSLQN